MPRRSLKKLLGQTLRLRRKKREAENREDYFCLVNCITRKPVAMIAVDDLWDQDGNSFDFDDI